MRMLKFNGLSKTIVLAWIILVCARDSFAVDLLARGASPYDVAKLLGDTVDTVEKHYAPFVRELRERTRCFMEIGEGLEITGTQQAQQKAVQRKFNENKREIGGAGEPISRILLVCIENT